MSCAISLDLLSICGIMNTHNEKGMIGMTFNELYSAEKKLMKEIDKEKGFTWNKLFKIIKLNALMSSSNTL